MLRMGRHTVIPAGIMGVQTFAPRSAAAAANWWEVSGKTCVAAYQPKGAASYAASLTNLANPGTYDAAEGVAPAWTTGAGWEFDGVDDYLDTGIVPQAGDTTIIKFTNRLNTGPLWSTMDTATWQRYACAAENPGYEEWNVQFFCAGNQAQNWGYGVNMTAGVLAVAGQYLYRDGTVASNECGGWTGPTTQPILICTMPAGFGSPQYGAYTIQAFAHYRATLTTAENATLAEAMAAL